MMSNDDSHSISLKVVVEKDKNRVVFVESNKDFVDVLFSFMTMPIGNIVRLAREYSLDEDFGCLNNLYESVEKLDEEHLESVKCKDMLLHPRSAAEIYCRNLKLNFENSDTNEYYICSLYGHCFGPYYLARCHCGYNMSYAWNLNNSLSVPQDGGVFVNPTTRFMITDDFHVKPISTTSILALLSKFEATDRSTREERTIKIGRDKVMKLLSCSLTARAPFSEIILETIDESSFGICREKYDPRSTNQLQRAVDATRNETKITLNLIIRKSSNRALYVEANEDFVNLIGSFLTYPLGYIFEKLPCLSLRGCLDNMYKSIQGLDAKKFLKSEEMKAILINPKLPRGLALHNQLISIEEASYPSYSTVSSLFNISRRGSLTGPGEAITGKGFFRGPSMFMVTDDLTIMPLSPTSLVCFIDKFNIPHNDILEQEVIIGVEEAMSLLGAALVSKTALTDVFILKESKQEL